MVDEHVFPSTTWDEIRVKVRRRPQGSATARRSRSPWGGLPRRSKHLKLTVTVQWKGGSCPWFLVEARGRSGVVDGSLSLYDTVMRVNNTPPY